VMRVARGMIIEPRERRVVDLHAGGRRRREW